MGLGLSPKFAVWQCTVVQGGFDPIKT